MTEEQGNYTRANETSQRRKTVFWVQLQCSLMVQLQSLAAKRHLRVSFISAEDRHRMQGQIEILIFFKCVFSFFTLKIERAGKMLKKRSVLHELLKRAFLPLLLSSDFERENIWTLSPVKNVLSEYILVQIRKKKQYFKYIWKRGEDQSRKIYSWYREGNSSYCRRF